MKSFTWGNKTFLAILTKEHQVPCDHIIFHDLTANETLSKSLPIGGAILDIAFSPHGKLVVSHCTKKRGHFRTGRLFIFDFKVKAIGEIGDPRAICSSKNGHYKSITSFSADGLKVAVSFLSFHSELGRSLRVIHLEKEKVLIEPDGDFETALQDHSTWNAIAN